SAVSAVGCASNSPLFASVSPPNTAPRIKPTPPAPYATYVTAGTPRGAGRSPPGTAVLVGGDSGAEPEAGGSSVSVRVSRSWKVILRWISGAPAAGPGC